MDPRRSGARRGRRSRRGREARRASAARRGRSGAAAAGAACLAALLLPVATVAGPAGAAGAAGTASAAGGAGTSDPASLVDTFVGTGSGGPIVGAIDAFPGADMPFGMLQWSPDTYPNRAEGGGYTFTTSAISGFSLTHLSGVGCSIFGDVPVLPTSGAVPPDPANADEPFSHATESASPGRYQVQVGSPATGVQLAATTRTGIGQFTFPAGAAGNLLFKVSGSQSFVIGSTVQVVGTDELEGSVTSGGFCTTPTTYTLHFVATFDRPFAGHGTWQASGLSPGSSRCSGATCGAWVSFATTADRSVTMKVGISYVSLAGAAANLHHEDPGWSLSQVEARATSAWSSILGRIDVQGGSLTHRQELSTALYHSLLEPTVFSDDDGRYVGADGKVHTTHGRVQYANYSAWDVYRSEMPLLSMIDPKAVSTMMQSLVNDAAQGGWLPVWEVAGSDAQTMDADAADPIIADAYAFGVRGFDVRAALAAMLKGAETVQKPGTGPDQAIERPNLATFESLGYVPQTGVDPYSLGETIGASETLEYAIDDFAVAKVAEALGDRSAARRMTAGAQHWQELFNPSTGYVQARLTDGAFPAGPAMQYLSASAIALNLYQQGFAEGNAVQYTWSVPQDLGGLFALMGGDAAVDADLGTFFQQTNAGPWLPYDWSGNEPDLWVPWEYDYAGEPWQAQATVRTIATTDYALTPSGEPGNDDLGAMSSWYVWAALGLYPVTPGTADLAMASPMFPRTTIHLGSGKELHIVAKGAPDEYVSSARLAVGSGAARALDRPWLPASVVRHGGTLDVSLSARPDRTWGAAPQDAPPSYGTGAAGAVGFVEPSGLVTVAPGAATPVTLGAQAGSAHPVALTWKATAPSGVTVTPATGRFELHGGTSGGRTARATTTLDVTAPTPGTYDLHVTVTEPGGTR
jgi:predicted alpha-1,2-mannosidase